MHGSGTATYMDGSTYKGTFRNGKRNGKGTEKAANGEVYVG